MLGLHQLYSLLSHQDNKSCWILNDICTCTYFWLDKIEILIRIIWFDKSLVLRCRRKMVFIFKNKDFYHKILTSLCASFYVHDFSNMHPGLGTYANFCTGSKFLFIQFAFPSNIIIETSRFFRWLKYLQDNI